MIKFKTVECRNFMSIGTKPIKIQLDKDPTTLVQGKNGASKSSVFLDTLSWALYGKAFRNIRKGQLVNSTNKKDCMVDVEFEIGSKQYKVRRGMFPEIFEIYENGTLLKNIGSGRLDYQEYLEKKILRINHKSFCQIVTIGSATFIPFMNLSPGGRREIIEDLLDLQVFSQMNRLLKQRVDENRNAVADMKYEVEILEEKIKLQKQYIQNIKNKAETDREDVLQRISSTSLQIENHQTAIGTLDAEIISLNDLIEDEDKMVRRKKQYTQVEGQLKERSTKLRKEMKFLEDNDHCPTCKQEIDHDFKCDSVNKKQIKLDEITLAATQVVDEVEKVDDRLKEIAKHQKRITGLQSEISKINSEIRGLNTYISGLQKELKEENNSFTSESEESKLLEYYETKKLLDDRRGELLTQKGVYDIAAVLLKDGGIKAKIIKQYVPVINAAINKYLSVLDLNVQFEIDENFNETIKSRYREEFSYASFSEGEKKRIDLAITFAWRAIAKMRNSSSTNLLILDEVADGGVDSDGIDDLVKILGTMGDTHVFVISHRESMLDKFDACIKFEKIKGFSHIAEE